MGKEDCGRGSKGKEAVELDDKTSGKTNKQKKTLETEDKGEIRGHKDDDREENTTEENKGGFSVMNGMHTNRTKTIMLHNAKQKTTKRTRGVSRRYGTSHNGLVLSFERH
jgi:hypothetical protein